MARLTAASSGSGVDRPCWMEMPLVPMTAMSARRSASASRASGPTAAWVRPRTWPPRTRTARRSWPARAEAVSTEEVIMVSGVPVGRRRASAPVVVPASMSRVVPGVRARAPRARAAMARLAGALVRSRSRTPVSGS